MQLIVDSHVFIGMARSTVDADYPKLAQLVADSTNQCFLSVASIWEIAIKVRLGKLHLGLPLNKIEVYCAGAALQILPVNLEHAIRHLSPEPTTRDPFDRLLLAQCAVEGMQLVTADQHLAEHPLAAR